MPVASERLPARGGPSPVVTFALYFTSTVFMPDWKKRAVTLVMFPRS
jgi:hypothetical protein